jgi:hypothetical protein
MSKTGMGPQIGKPNFAQGFQHIIQEQTSMLFKGFIYLRTSKYICSKSVLDK